MGDGMRVTDGGMEALLAPGEMYTRYSEGQALVAQERGLRREAELYLTKILQVRVCVHVCACLWD